MFAMPVDTPALYDPVATGIFDPIFSVARCPSVARMRGFCRMRVSESDSSAFTVPPVTVTAKFVAFRLPSVFSVRFEEVVGVVVPVVVVVVVVLVLLALLACGRQAEACRQRDAQVALFLPAYLQHRHVDHHLRPRPVEVVDDLLRQDQLVGRRAHE